MATQQFSVEMYLQYHDPKKYFMTGIAGGP